MFRLNELTDWRLRPSTEEPQKDFPTFRLENLREQIKKIISESINRKITDYV
jgi:hypothetical protein